MNVTYLSSCLSRRAGGIFEIQLALAHSLRKAGMRLECHALMDEEWKLDAHRWEGIQTVLHPTSGPRSFGYSRTLLPSLLAGRCDLAHLHNLWMYPSVALARWHAKGRVPYMVTPNGMLEPWALANSAIKKRVASFLFEKNTLRQAACLHANTAKEVADFRRFGLKNPVCVLPNGVDLAEIGDGIPEMGDRKKIMLFLGRLHPKKGLMDAIRAWHAVRVEGLEAGAGNDWRFVIAGWDQGGHEDDLKRLARELDLRWADLRDLESRDPGGDFEHEDCTLLFHGPAFGEGKDKLLRSASAFILPSLSEGLPMAVLEAWSHGLPVLMTGPCNLPEGFACGAALRLDPPGQAADRPLARVAGIGAALRQMFGMSDAELAEMGCRGRALVARQFTWPVISRQLLQVYQWVLGGGPPPESVECS
jgi:glycosyltransferase involved in cell wall biosynthesis